MSRPPHPRSPPHQAPTPPQRPPTPYRLVQPKAKSKGYLTKGDLVLLFSTPEQRWKTVRLTGHSGTKHYQQSSYYWNWTDLDGTNPQGSYLYQGQLWGVLRGPDTNFTNIDLATVSPHLPTLTIPQVDGPPCTPDTLTPNTSPDTSASQPVSPQGVHLLPQSLVEELSLPDPQDPPHHHFPLRLPQDIATVARVDPSWLGEDEQSTVLTPNALPLPHQDLPELEDLSLDTQDTWVWTPLGWLRTGRTGTQET